MLPKVGSQIGSWTPKTNNMVTKSVTTRDRDGINQTQTRTFAESQNVLSEWRYSRGHSPVTGGNEEDDALVGHAEWLGNKLTFGAGRWNYWFIPAAENRVSFCVIKPDTLAIGGYVISDNYGGCEYHEAINTATGELALLHVFRGSGGLTKYTLRPNWQLRSTLLSNAFVKMIPYKVGNPGQRDGSVLSISYIPPCRLIKDFKINSDFICVKAGVVTHTLQGGLRQAVMG